MPKFYPGFTQAALARELLAIRAGVADARARILKTQHAATVLQDSAHSARTYRTHDIQDETLDALTDIVESLNAVAATLQGI